MYSLLWLAPLVSCVSGNQPEKTPLIRQYIREHLKKFVVDRPVDEQIDPCDNFFTHVCPTTIRREETPRARAASPEFVDQLDKLVAPKQFEKETNIAFLGALRHHIAIIKSLDGDESLKMLREQFDRLTETIISQVDKSWPDLQNTTVDDLRHTVARNTLFSGLINIDNWRLENLLDELNKMYDEVKEKSGQAFATQVIKKTIRCLSLFFKPLAQAIEYDLFPQSIFFSAYQMPSLLNLYFLLSAKEDVAVKYGSTFAVAGHEMHHAILGNSVSNDSRLISHGICLRNHLQMVFNEFVNDESHDVEFHKNGDTYPEDSPDFEGLHSAYLSLVNTPGIDIEEIPYKELGFTRRKLFFYAYASLRCVDAQNPNRKGARHSPSFVRVLGTFTLSKTFMETFQCKPESRMRKIYDAADPTKCNHLGEAVRKI